MPLSFADIEAAARLYEITGLQNKADFVNAMRELDNAYLELVNQK